MPNPNETLAPQFRAVLQQFTKSARIDEMVHALIAVVERDAPRVEIPVPVEPCHHITQLRKQDDGVKRLVCKKCHRIVPI